MRRRALERLQQDILANIARILGNVAHRGEAIYESKSAATMQVAAWERAKLKRGAAQSSLPSSSGATSSTTALAVSSTSSPGSSNGGQ